MDYHYRPPTASSYGATNPPYGVQGQAPYAGHASQGGYPPYNARPNVPAGGGYGYPTPAPPQQPQAQPPSDPFRAYYAGRLRELTFNSRPIIQDLSLIAMQQRDAGNWPNMNAVVEEIEGAVLRASPQSKLPILYLIDSISKNVGAPYTTTLLPPIIPRLYRRTYREVDGVTKAKMEEMIALWRTGGPNRTDLYGPDVRLAIERDIFGSAGAPARPTQQPQQRFPTKDQVLQTLHATLDTKQRESATKPWDATPRHQVGVLQQIAQLLATTDVSPQELQNIMEQLKSMVPPIAAATPPTHTTFTPPPYPPQPPSTTSMPAPNLPPFPPPLIRDEGYRSVSNPLSAVPPNMTTPTINGQTPVPGSVTPVPVASSTPIPAPVPLAPVIPANVADILRNLNSSGLLSNPRTPDSANVSLPTKNLLASYEDMVLSMDLRLESLDLNRMSALPVSHLPVRCKQCGIRFPEGESKMQAHLDWHFRRNKSKTETGGRGAHRRWLPRAEEWVNDFAANAEPGPSTSTAIPNSPSTGTSTAGAKLTAEQLARYAARTIRAPTNPVQAGKPCPICKEPFKAELEDDEWIWRNAIEINGVIYHATCRAEQMQARKIAKMLTPGGRVSSSKSPGLTPQPGEPADMSVREESVRPAEIEAEVKQEAGPLNGAATTTPAVEAQADPSSVPIKRKAEDTEGDEAKRVKVDEDEAASAAPLVPDMPMPVETDGVGEAVTAIGEPSGDGTAEAQIGDIQLADAGSA